MPKFYFESNTYLHFKDDYGMRKNDGQCFDLALDRISKRIKETERIKSKPKFGNCGNCRNVISLLILFCPCQKSDDAPRNFREAPRDDKIKLFHELWWEHFWS